MNTRIISAPLAALAGLMLVFGQAYGGETSVNCDKGDSIQKAIDTGAGSAARKVIYVTGFCEEDLLITRDNISLLGDGNTMISGQIGVRGSDGLTIRDLSITGPGDGISASVSRIFMTNVHIVGNYGDGIALRHGGAVFLYDGSISGNLGDSGFLIENGHGQLENTEVSNNANDGIVVNVNGNLTMIGGKVDIHEQGTGITANLSSSVELEDVSVSNNETGISVLSGSAAAINNSTINGNTNTGVFLSMSSSATIDSTAIYENGRGAAASRHSFVTLSGPTEVRDNESDGLRLLFGSGAVVSGGVSIPTHPSGWAVYCRDAESNLSNRAGVTTNCQGFNLL
jgi:hypothetical protein